MTEEYQCNACKTVKQDPLQCTGCRKVYYCDKNCQSKDWNVHKSVCKYINKKKVLEVSKSLEEQVGSFVNTVSLDDLDHNIGVVRRLKYVSSDKKYVVDRISEGFELGLLKPLPLIYQTCIELRDSPIHGKGVFALQDIPPNTIVTYFPAHFIYTKGKNGLNVYHSHNGATNLPIDTLAQYRREYSYDCIVGNNGERDKFTIIGNPNVYDNPLLLGHMVNDACGNIFHHVNAQNLRKERNLINLIKKYYTITEEKRNCGMDENSSGSVVCIITTREVKKGEELLTGYGVLYWLIREYGVKYRENYPHIVKTLDKIEEDQEFIDFMLSLK